MKKIFLCSPASNEDKRLIRGIQLELEGRGAEVTFDSSDSFDIAITVANTEDDVYDSLSKKEASIFCLYYENDDVPNGVTAILRPISLDKFADSLLRGATSEIKVADELKELTFVSGQLTYGKDVIALSETEAQLFSILYEKRGMPVSREDIKKRIWGIGETNVVEVYVNYLRKKLDLRYDKKFIVTVRNKGYMLL